MLPPQFDVGLEASGTFAAEPPNYPNGCHVCEVEVDPETGAVTLARYAAVDDVGKIMNHLLCEGQIHGGVAQGVGQALMEAIVFDAAGQLVTGSFQDYAMPRAEDFPELTSELTEVPATNQSARRQGRGRSRRHRRAARGHRRHSRRVKAARHRPHRHAGDAEPGVGGDQRARRNKGHGGINQMNAPANLFNDGKAYERLMGRWSQLAGAKFLDWLDAPKGLHWIDVGCGNGAFTEVLISRGAPAAVTGIDPSDGQLSYARTRPGTKLAQFRIGDAQALPFADNSFDAASMALVITFVPDPVKAAKEMARVVKPGGSVATYMWDFDGGGFPLLPLYAAMDALNIPVVLPPGRQASRQKEMRAIWEHAGLQSVATEVIRIRVAYTDFDDFWDSEHLAGWAKRQNARWAPAKRKRTT